MAIRVDGDDASRRVGDAPQRDATITPFPTARRNVRPAKPEPEPEPLLRELVGEVLREERIRQGRTLRDVARQAAVSLPYLSEVERGRKDVSSDVLDAIHRALDLELAEVLERAASRLVSGSQRFGRPMMMAA